MYNYNYYYYLLLKQIFIKKLYIKLRLFEYILSTILSHNSMFYLPFICKIYYKFLTEKK